MSARVAVFHPSPLVSVTVELDGHGRPEVHFHPAGQGYWVARMIRTLGARAVLCAPLGGESGQVLRALFQARGLELRGVPVRASNGVYLHDRRRGRRELVAETDAAVLTRHEKDDLYNLFLGAALEADAAVLTGPAQPGVLEPELYGRLARDLDANGARVVADLSGPFLRALEGPVALLKIAHDELREAGFAGEGLEGLARGMRRLAERGARVVVCSRAEKPALVLAEGRFVEARGPTLEAVDPSGAGDSMTAALAVGIARGAPLEETLRAAVAAGALNVTRRGLGSGRRESIAQLAAHVELRPRPELELGARGEQPGHPPL